MHMPPASTPSVGRLPSRRSPLAVLVIMIASLAPLVGCGGSSSESVRSTPAEASGSEAPPKASTPAPGGPLSAQLARTLPEKRKPPSAVVTFAVFRPQPVEDVAADLSAAEALMRAALATPPAALAGLVKGPMPEPELIAAPVDADLPLDIAGLAAGAGEAKPVIDQARSVWFVRYAGEPHADAAQVKAVAATAGAFAQPGTAVVDLGTRRAWTATAYMAWVAADDWLADQVRVDAQQAEDGTVTFFTRGMARFGQPDLEAARVAPADARARFEAFQALLAALRAHGPARPGDTVGGVKLGRCTRPPEAIERTCVSM